MLAFSISLFILTLLLNGWLFQLLAYRVLSSQPNRAQARANVLEGTFAGIVGDVILVSWVGIVLAELGWFSLGALAALMTIIGLGLFASARWQGITFLPSAKLQLDYCDVLALCIVVLAGILYTPPGEQIVGGEDPGTYINTGINLGQTGKITVRDRTLSTTDPVLARGVLYSPSAGPGREGIRFPGFYVQDVSSGTVTPQFFHVLPVWIATLYQIGGVHAALLVTPLFGCFALLALYLLGRRLINPAAGVFAMALLAVNISQVWFARSAFAEIIVQFLLLSGFWTLALFVENSGRDDSPAIAIALLSGACFGISHLTKLDVFVAPLVVLGLAAYAWFDRILHPSYIVFVGIYFFLAVHSALHGYLFSRPYVSDIFSMFGKYVRLGLRGAAVLCPLALLVAWQRGRIARFLNHLFKHRGCISLAFVLVVLMAGFYAYFVRPLRADLGAMDDEDFADQGRVFSWLRPLAIDPQMRRGVRTFIEEGIVRTAWYVTPMGIWFGIAGFLYWVTTKTSLRSGPFLMGSFFSAVLLFYRGTLVPHFFWAFKRYIPLLIPSFMLCIAFILNDLWSASRSRWQSAILPLVIGSFLLVSYVQGSMKFWKHIEWEGAIEDVEALAKTLPEDSVLLFRKSPAGLRLGLPLLYIHNRDLFLVDNGYQNNARLRDLVARWREQGRPVYWLETGTDPSITSYGPLVLQKETDMSWPVAPHTKDRLPDRISQFSPHVGIYAIEATEYAFPDDLGANFGNQVALLGYELDTQRVAPGGELHLTLHWQALQSMNTDYTVFTHLLDHQSTIMGQKDSQPVQGKRPTTSWLDGEIIRDSVIVPVHSDAQPGTYWLQVGLYELATMKRLPVLDSSGEIAGDKVILESVEVIPSPDLGISPP